MGFGVSVIIAAVGAVLLWGVKASVVGVDVDSIGLILLVVGIAGALLSLVFWATWGFGARDERVVGRRKPPSAAP